MSKHNYWTDGNITADRVRVPANWREQAERTVSLSIPDAERLPNILGRIVSANLRVKGWYGATVEGVRTLYVLEGVSL